MTAITAPEVSSRREGRAVSPRPPSTARPGRRLILVGIGVLMALTFVRGLFWVVTFPVWSGDEGAHFSYEQSVATGHGIPVAGRSLNSADTLLVAKESPVSSERTFPVPPVKSVRWGIIDQQYEGVQSPLYYVLLVPVYWAGRAVDGVVGSFYALRLASLCMAVVTIPLTAILARALLPRHRSVWLLAPAVIAVLQIVNVQNSYIDNDGLTMVVAIACLLALLACRGDLRPRRAALFGTTLGAALLTKATLAALVPALLIAMVAYVVRRRPSVRPVAVWVGVAAGVTVVVVVPYLVFNLAEYHALSGARAAAAIIEPTMGSTPVSLSGARMLTETFVDTLFIGQGIPGPSYTVQYHRLWEIIAVVATVTALAGALVRQRWDELAIVGWIVVSIPLGVVVLIVAGFNQSGGEASVVARYLDCLLPLFAIVVGYGAVAALGSRIGSVTLLSLLVAASFVEVSGDRAWVRAVYTADIIGRSVPVVEQSYVDDAAPLSSIKATVRCPADAVALPLIGPPSPSVIAVNGRTSLAPVTDGVFWIEYGLDRPVEGRLVITFPQPLNVGFGVARTLGPLDGPAGSVARTARGLPAIRIYCEVADPSGARFHQLYPTNHPPLSLGELLAWPEVEAWVGLALVLALAGAVAVSTAGPSGAHRRRSAPTG
jgi:4-amino-4-deoxy-L-arabinose transferase-like glycosyltransferase